jgi:nitrogen fixation NifU-like protein
MDDYNDTVMDHVLRPRNVGRFEAADGMGVVENETCGDMVEISIQVRDGRIAAARFRVFGCGAAIASSSLTTELVQGWTLEQAAALTPEQVTAALDGLPARKMACSVLAPAALARAVADYRARA